MAIFSQPRAYPMTDLNIIEVTTLEEFTERIKHIDWYHHFSDDHRVYREGKTQIKYYEELARKNGSKWCDAWDNQRAEVFSEERGFGPGGPVPIRRNTITHEWLRSPEYKAAMDDLAERYKDVPTHELEREE